MSRLLLKFRPYITISYLRGEGLQGKEIGYEFPGGADLPPELTDVIMRAIEDGTTEFLLLYNNPGRWYVYDYEYDKVNNYINLYVINPGGVDMESSVLIDALNLYGQRYPGASLPIQQVVPEDKIRSWGKRVYLRPYVAEVWLLSPTGTRNEYSFHQVDVQSLLGHPLAPGAIATWDEREHQLMFAHLVHSGQIWRP